MTRMPQFLKKKHTQILNVWSIYIQNWDKQNIAEQSSQQIRVFHPFHQISHLKKSLVCSHLSFKGAMVSLVFFRMNSLSLCWSMSTPITPPQSTLHSHERFEGLDLFSFQMLRSWRNHEKIRPFTGDFFKVFARSQRKATKTLNTTGWFFESSPWPNQMMTLHPRKPTWIPKKQTSEKIGFLGLEVKLQRFFCC